MKRQRESASGFHFFNLYQCCPRKFYFKYILGWKSQFTAPALLNGSAFHAGKAAFYGGNDEGGSIKLMMDLVKEAREEIQDQEEVEKMLYRLPILMEKWIEKFGRFDLENFEVVQVEKELRVPLEGTKFSVTIRPDAVLKSKQEGHIFVMETKTSGFSHRITGEAVLYGDQATAYLWGVRKVTGLKAYAVIPDIVYWNKIAKDTNNIQILRPELVFRDEERCRRFEVGVRQILMDIAQRAQAYKEGFDPWGLFPRNSNYCLSFSTPCDFAEVCGQDCEKCKVPDGFLKEGGVKRTKKRLGIVVDDTISLVG